MACGSFPIVGDIASVREWIEPGVNGLLADPNDAVSLSTAMTAALENASLRHHAASVNHAIVNKRASREAVRPDLARFYDLVGQRAS
jgi:glycosyltransferase involved in cell wall biosynthesis